MLTYNRTSGLLYRDNQAIGWCYSGHGQGFMNVAMETVVNAGPLPAGQYALQEITGPELKALKKGPNVFRLVPAVTNAMHGRSGFLIHWDNKEQNFTASDGCIIPVMPIVWQRIKHGDVLTVV